MTVRYIGVIFMTALLLARLPVSNAKAGDSRSHFVPPNGWNEISHSNKDDRQETLYLPEGQTPGNWSQMITLIKLKDNSEEAMHSLVDQTMRQAMLLCKEPPLTRGRFRNGTGLEDGYIAETACDKTGADINDKNPALNRELLRIFVDQRKDGIIMLKYNWRHARISARKRFDDPAQLNSFSNVIEDLR
ncbi:hypothetical protein DFP90_101613 [Aestuariispira insulae]|uniref:Uncharacterized protein n=2 Tax=Aestuariispira insulae TaxID=1461337 RepID=A0A3D9HWC2_9PROT|nr:hypothetical protein DFP90_101613 [Aestuariispira insulae]